MQNTSRDSCICADYRSGSTTGELAREHGLSETRINQILRSHRVDRRPKFSDAAKVRSSFHARIGEKVYDHRFGLEQDVYDAATAIGISAIKLRKIEKGVCELELLDLLDLAAYIGVEVGELLERPNATH